MRYEEFRPTEALARFIKCFWMLESAAAPLADPERILPDGCTEIVFHLADPFDQHGSDGAAQRQPLALLVGQMRRHLLIKPTGRVSVLGVRFWPGGAYPFLAVPQDEIAGQVIALDAVWGAITRELHSRIADAVAAADRVKQVEAILLARLNNFRRHDDGATQAIGLILRSGGCVPIESLAESMGIGLRKLDRTFNTRVGLTPKGLSRIVRFQRALKMIEQNENRDWVRIALDCGYYDQPHFIKEFGAIAGIAPSSYFAGQNSISELFIAAS